MKCLVLMEVDIDIENLSEKGAAKFVNEYVNSADYIYQNEIPNANVHNPKVLSVVQQTEKEDENESNT